MLWLLKALTYRKFIFRYAATSVESSKSNLYIKVIGSRSRSQQQKRVKSHPVTPSVTDIAQRQVNFSHSVYDGTYLQPCARAATDMLRVQTSNCWSAAARRVCGLKISFQQTYRVIIERVCIVFAGGLPSIETQCRWSSFWNMFSPTLIFEPVTLKTWLVPDPTTRNIPVSFGSIPFSGSGDFYGHRWLILTFALVIWLSWVSCGPVID